MKRVFALAAVVLTVGLLAWLGVTRGATATASDSTVRLAGDCSFKANKRVACDFRFVPGSIEVKSGTIVEFTAEPNVVDEPHTISIVDEGDLPTNIVDAFTCGEPGTVCGPLFEGHFAGGEGSPPVPVLNAGDPGLDTPGDSLFVDDGESVSAVISAPPGTTLHYLCIFHSWMQGDIKVKKSD